MALNARFAMTNSQMPLVERGSIVQRDWFIFLYNLYLSAIEGLPQPAESIDLGASPYSYQAVIRGQIHVGGGTVSAIEFSRDGVTWFDAGITAGFVTMDARDYVRVAYSVAPTITFFPM